VGEHHWVKVARRRRPVVALSVAVGFVLALILSPPRPGPFTTTFVATNRLVLSPSASSAPPETIVGSDTAAVAEAVRNPGVAKRVGEELRFHGDPSILSRQVAVSDDKATAGIALSTRIEGSSSDAEQLADTFASQVVAFLADQAKAARQQSLDTASPPTEPIQAGIRQLDARIAKAPVRDRASLRAQRDALQRQLNAATARSKELAAQPPPAPRLVSAGPSVARAVPDHRLRAPGDWPGRLLLLLALTVLGTMMAALVEVLDPRIRSGRRAERAFGVPLLAEIPTAHQNGDALEAYRTLRATVAPLTGEGAIRNVVPVNGSSGTGPVPTHPGFAQRADPVPSFIAYRVATGRPPSTTTKSRQVVLVSSAANEERGSASALAVNLAAGIAEAGSTVTVIDCDLDEPQLHRQLGIDNSRGLGDVLGAGSSGSALNDLTVPGPRPGFDLIVAGRPPAERAGLLARRLSLLGVIGGPGDVVVLIAPPLPDQEALDLAPMADSVVLACFSGTTRATDAQQAGKLLRQMGIPRVGAVFLEDPKPPVPEDGAPVDPATEESALGDSAQEAAGGTTGQGRRHPLPQLRRLRVRGLAGWGITAVAMVVLSLLMRAFVFQSFSIPSESMVPALIPGDRVLVSELSYRLHDVHRGDVVVFGRPRIEASPEVKHLIKRVIALPGETVESNGGHLLVDGKAIPEPYLRPLAIADDFPRQRVPEDHYWVMGDNRNDSADSRVFGPISKSLIVGRAFVVVWPLPSLHPL